MALAAGARLGPYEILGLVGAGGMGEVYRARDTRLGREVAVKVLPAELATDADRRARFEQEARAASALNHPNIVVVHDVGFEAMTPYVAMELVDGRTLREILASGPLPVRKVLDAAVQVADGLAKAHAAGIVHRDLKPDNLIVSSDGFVKILDFGLAKVTSVLPTAEDSQLPTLEKHETGCRDGDGHGGLHVARAGERPERRLPLRPVLPGLGAVRDGDGPAGVQAGHGGGDALGHHPGGSAADRPGQPDGAASVRLGRGALPGQGPGGALRLDPGPGAGAAQRPGPPLGQHAHAGGTPAAAALAGRGDRRRARARRPRRSESGERTRRRRRRSGAGGHGRSRWHRSSESPWVPSRTAPATPGWIRSAPCSWTG